MRIGIDCSCVAKQERTGVARYCASLLHSLVSVLEPDDKVAMLYRLSRFKKRRWFEEVADPRFTTCAFQDRIGALPPRKLDVVHGPDLRLPSIPRVPAVSTVHDLSALDVPGIAREAFKEKKLRQLAVVAEGAAAILCISEFTRDAFLSRFPAAEARARVLPLGLAPRFVPQSDEQIAAARAEIGVKGRYLLFVGQIAARKNLGPLIDAFIALRAEARFADLELVLAGPVQTGGADVLARIESSDVADAVRMTGFVGDDVLTGLYSGAAAFCFTGKAEGFGLPILEAMACACPVVVADAGASASTAGGAAAVVPPDDAGALRDALVPILDDAAVRADLVARGRTRAARFSWDATARETVAAYRFAIETGAPA